MDDLDFDNAVSSILTSKSWQTKGYRVAFKSLFARKEETDGLQGVHTPFTLCHEILTKLSQYCDLSKKSILVMFNLEFVDVLIKDFNVSSKNITFLTDSVVKHVAAMEWYCVDSMYEPKMGAKKMPEISKKFDVIMGNPPYQTSDGGHNRSAKPIYHHFIEHAIERIPEYLVCVCPSRWMVGGKGLDKFRKRIINDRHIKLMVDEMSPNRWFPSVSIAGGVNYFVWNKDYNGECDFNGVERFLNEEDIVIRENEARSILSKVKRVAKKFIGETVSPRKPYGLEGETVSPMKGGVPCWFKQSIGLITINPSLVKNPRNDVHLWRVLAPRAGLEHAGYSPKPMSFFSKNSIIVAKPSEYCTETYVVVRALKSEIEAKNFVSYLRTRFFRFMLRMRTISQDITRDCYNWIPDVADYSKAWTDKELYTLFDLSQDEQAFIQNKVKEI